MATVLVVEDSRTQREMLLGFLRSNGLKTIAACDGFEALKQVRARRPDLVVLDIVLPRMNGYEVCRRLRSYEKTKKLPILMCSEKCERFDFYWALKQGADAYLDKPVRPEELIETVKFLLRTSEKAIASPSSSRPSTKKRGWRGFDAIATHPPQLKPRSVLV